VSAKRTGLYEFHLSPHEMNEGLGNPVFKLLSDLHKSIIVWLPGRVLQHTGVELILQVPINGTSMYRILEEISPALAHFLSSGQSSG